MAENTTSPWGLPYPGGVGKVNLGATDFNELATKLNTIFNEKFLIVKTSAVEITAKAGELVEMTAAGTVNLPKAAAANTIAGVFAQKGEVTVKTTSAEKIVGGALPEAGTSITLGTGQYALFDYDGTRYLVVGGVPKEYIGDTQIVKGRSLVHTENAIGELTERVSGTEYEPSGTEVAIVSLQFKPVNNTTVTLTVGGKIYKQWEKPTISDINSLVFPCPAKAKYKLEGGSGMNEYKTSYFLL